MLQLENLCCERHDRVVFERINLSLSPGEVVQVCGPNGCGKSSLLRMVAGLLPPEQGAVYWQGDSITQCSYYAAECIYMGHRHAMQGHLTPLENLELALLLKAVTLLDSSQALSYTLRQWGLVAHQYQLTHSLSAGMQRRIALAQLSLVDSVLWLLDEPYTSLDAHGAQQLTDLIVAHRERGGMVLLASHQTLPITGVGKLPLDRGQSAATLNLPVSAPATTGMQRESMSIAQEDLSYLAAREATEMSCLKLLTCLWSQTAMAAWRQRGQGLIPLFFLMMMVSIFPIVLDSDPQQLQHLAAAILWIGMLLAELLILPHLFDSAFVDGSLEQILLCPYATLVICFKIIFHWIFNVIPLLFLLTVVVLVLNWLPCKLVLLIMSLVMATLLLHLLGSMVTALILGVRQGSMLLPLLVVPLYIPVILLGLASISAATLISVPMALLLALLCVSLAGLPWLITAALRIGIQSS